MCPIDYALEVFGDRWTLLILRDLLLVGKRHYHELLASREGISTNILAARIRKLEAYGLLERRRSSSDRRELIYQPTDRAIDLMPVLVEIGYWSASHNPNTAFPLANFGRYRKDRSRWIAELTASARQRRDQDRPAQRAARGKGMP